MEDNHGGKDIGIVRKGALVTEILPSVIGLLPSLSTVTFVRYCPSTGCDRTCELGGDALGIEPGRDDGGFCLGRNLDQDNASVGIV